MQDATSHRTPAQIGARLSELCNQGQFEQAISELYAPDAVSMEPDGMTHRGLEEMKAKSDEWYANVAETHSVSAGEPVVAGNFIAMRLYFDMTFKDRGRVPIDELAVYEVRDGKVVSERFFY